MQLPERYRLDGDGAPVDTPVGKLLTAIDAERRVTIEVLRSEIAADPQQRAVYLSEVRRCAFLVHRCILPVHEIGETADGLPFVVTPAYDEIVSRVSAPPRWDELSAWLDQFLEALAHLHARGLIHGQLTPDRLWLHGNKPRDLWLVDPGRSAAADALGLRSGHPRYLAPEQLTDQANEIGPSSDLYAFGVIAWELITGRSPFSGRTSPIDTELPAFEPRLDVPPRVETILANLLRADPLSRYDLAADVRTELDAAVSSTVTRRAIRDGTVAPSASARYVPDPVGELDEVTFDPVVERGPGARPPRWNRPYPQPIAEYPPSRPTTTGCPPTPGSAPAASCR